MKDLRTLRLIDLDKISTSYYLRDAQKYENQFQSIRKPIQDSKVLVFQLHYHHTQNDDVFKTTDDETFRDKSDFYTSISRYWAKNFADRNNFEYRFKVTKQPSYFEKCNSANFLKYESLRYLKDYDIVLYLDTDVMIGPHVENFIKYYNDGLNNVVFLSRIGIQLENQDNFQKRGYGGFINSGVLLLFSKTIRHPRFGNRCYRDLKNFLDHYPEKYLTKYRSGFYNDETTFYQYCVANNIAFQHLNQRFNFNYDEDPNKTDHVLHFIGYKKEYMNEVHKLWSK